MKNSLISFRLTGVIVLTVVVLLHPAFPQTTATDTLVLQAGPEGKDCYICDCSPGVNSPNGGITLLYQGQFQSCYDRLLIQWDLSALPANATILKAEMKLYCYNLYGSKAAGKMTYYRITSFWNEDSVTFSTRPDTSHDITVIVNQWPMGGNWHSVDITPFVRGWHEGRFPNYGIYGHCIQTNGTCVAGFHSSDHPTASQRPRLIIIYNAATAIQREPAPPEEFQLLQNYPNPFNGATTIKYDLQQPASVCLKIYNAQGQEVLTLAGGAQQLGNHEVQFDARNLASGVYFYKLETGHSVAVKKALLLR